MRINSLRIRLLQNWTWWEFLCPKAPMPNWKPTVWTSRFQSLLPLLISSIPISTHSFPGFSKPENSHILNFLSINSLSYSLRFSLTNLHYLRKGLEIYQNPKHQLEKKIWSASDSSNFVISTIYRNVILLANSSYIGMIWIKMWLLELKPINDMLPL